MSDTTPTVDAAQAPDSLACQQCGAALKTLRFARTVECPYCGSGNVVKRPPTPGIPPPAFVVGFARPEAEVRTLVARWGRALPWYTPRGFNALEVKSLRPVYLPAWLFEAEADVSWRASVGYEYTTTDGKESKTKVEWHDVHGQARLRVYDVLVSASRQVGNDDLERIEPFDYGRIARYSDAALAGWPAEEASRGPAAVRDELVAEAGAQLERRIAAMVPGERKKGPSVTWRLRSERVDALLVPVWTMLVRYSPARPAVRVLVNGQTGKVWGKAPVSWAKVVLAVLAALGLVALLALLRAGVPR